MEVDNLEHSIDYPVKNSNNPEELHKYIDFLHTEYDLEHQAVMESEDENKILRDEIADLRETLKIKEQELYRRAKIEEDLRQTIVDSKAKCSALSRLIIKYKKERNDENALNAKLTNERERWLTLLLDAGINPAENSFLRQN
eukprot:TRINITY_DN8278_c0_g1_i1.p1 TRINITY_DN8278_c0_g1~~TRINITY_DN8278_c0_g1_i1.p1  ORF type:complete len:142 (+),score=34.41 TRINITY_DN8278_c0_g1_i1:1-426(+)